MPYDWHYQLKISKTVTDRDRTRTCNPQIRSLMPYPLGHTATYMHSRQWYWFTDQWLALAKWNMKNVNDRDRTRTCNPQIRSLMPYPLGHTATYIHSRKWYWFSDQWLALAKWNMKNVNDRDRTRTCNPQIRSLMPYPLGHTATCMHKLKCYWFCALWLALST